MPPVLREDPYPGFNFLVQLGDRFGDPASVVAGFSDVSGLGVEVAYSEYRNGNERSGTPRLLPGLAAYAPIRLQRGIIGDSRMWDWINEISQGRIERIDGSIILLDESREEVMRWNFRRAWPSKVTGPSLNATANGVAIETLELSHEGLEVS